MFKISADWLEALSVVAATALAGVALWKQWKDEAARRKSVDATISADAYAVRRTLRAWVTSAQHIEAALVRTHGRIEGPFGAARVLRINPHTLRGRMRNLGLDWQRFRNPRFICADWLYA